ncbi:unnamed protein product [Orchesella dallaii]|uniref:Uncharacterized protein n=1 Tax=Orchesella dallaii TaxID=48710 RepID=A0ABP1PZF3_9HEXA
MSEGSSKARYHDTSPVQQVLFTESPKVTVTTPNPYNNRRNLQTTRFHTGRTSFSTTTTMISPEKSKEENENNLTQNENEENIASDESNDEDNEEDEQENGQIENFPPNDESDREAIDINEESHDNTKDDQENSSEEGEAGENNNILESSSVSVQTTTSAYTAMSEEESENEMGSQSGESQLKQMLLDEIPPHGKDDEQNLSSGGNGDLSSSQEEFNLAQTVKLTTTARPIITTKATKPLKTRQNTLTRIISRNFTRQGTTSTTISVDGPALSPTTEPSISSPSPSVTTVVLKYDYTMTPLERTKLKVKSFESSEQEVVTAKPLTKLRYRSTTPKGAAIVTPEPPSTAVPRTRGTTTATTPHEYGMKLGGERGSVESPIDIVPSPDLSHKNAQQSNSAEEADLTSASSEESKTSEKFLEVLVGNEDHKTLVTKKTDDGIVTSAILPPWYDTNGAINSSISEVLATNGTTVSNAVAKVENDIAPEGIVKFEESSNGFKSSENKQQTLANKDTRKLKHETGSEFERLVNIFSKQQSSSEEVPQTSFGYKKVKQVVLKKQVAGLLAQGSRYMPQVPGRANLFPASNKDADLANEESNNPTPVFENAQLAFNEPSGYVSRTGELLSTSELERVDLPDDYYSDDERNSDKTATHHSAESEVLSSDEMVDSTMESVPGVPPSHVIDVNFAEADNPQEIIIEQDSSARVEEGDFVSEDYAYREHPPTMSMAGSSSNQLVVAAPEDFVRGSGIRKPVSSEEETGNDLEGSGSSPVQINLSSTISTTSTSSPILSSSIPSVVIRRPAYTREEIAKSVVKPLAESVSNDDSLKKGEPAGSLQVTGSSEIEEYDDENYEQGSEENQEQGSGSVEQWSIEKVNAGQKWSAPDKVLDAVPNSPQQHTSEEYAMHQSAEQVVMHTQVDVPKNSAPGNDSNPQVQLASDSSISSIFKSPKLVSYLENKLNFSPPIKAEGEYHSKDGWRPVISGPPHNLSPSDSTRDPDLHYNADGSLEPDLVQADSFESDLSEDEPRQESPYQELPLPQQKLQQIPNESNGALEDQGTGKLKPSPMIPPPIPANVKFPDSEEDHEDRHHHGRHNPRQQVLMNNLDRAKYVVRPPPIVMRRHPHSTRPYLPPLALNNHQPPRPQTLLQASQSNPQFSEHPPHVLGTLPHINRNFHIRPNMPIRRFKFGTPQAQPRSGGNIKWPLEKYNDNNKTEQKIDMAASHSEIPTSQRRRR